MSSYSYGGLMVRVTADTKPLTHEVDTAAKTAGEKAARSLSDNITRGLGRAAGGLGKGIATALGGGVVALTAFGTQSIKVAAGVEKMNSVLGALAKANHVSRSAVDGTVNSLRKHGLTIEAAQATTAAFVKEHINLAQATRLSTVAQNAAAVSGKSVSEVMEGITKAVETGRTKQLQQYGVVVNTKDVYKEYAAELGTTASKLTEAQRQTAIMNAVMERGKTIAGAYAATLNDPAKVLGSFPRIAHDIQVSLGEQLLKGFGPAIVGVGKIARGLRDALAPGGALAPVLTAVGTAATQMLSPFTRLIDLTGKWLANLQPGQLSQITGQLLKFAPELASVGTALAAFAGKNLFGDLPVLGKFLGGLGRPLGILVTGLATLALTSPQARDALMGLVAVLMRSLAPILAELTPIIGQLGQALAGVLGSALRAVVPLVPPLVKVLQAALAVVIALLPVITWLTGVLARFAPEIMAVVAAWSAGSVAVRIYNADAEFNVLLQARQLAATVAQNASLLVLRVQIAAIVAWQAIVRVATIAWTAAQWLLNAALNANPIGIVIVALAALGAALYLAWTRSATFRTIVIGVWNAIWSVVAPIINKLVGLVRWMGDNWQSILRTTLQVMLAIATGGMSLLVQ